MKRRRLRRPSERNLTIYREVIIDGRAYRDVTREHQLSNFRIHQICTQVENYLGRLPANDRLMLAGPGRDLQLRMEYIEQLTHLRQQAMLEWQASREPQESLKVSTDQPGEDAGAPGSGKQRAGKRVATTTRSKRRGNVAALALAMRAVDRIFKLRGGHDATLTLEQSDELENLPPDEQHQLYLDWILDYLQEIGFTIRGPRTGAPLAGPPRLGPPAPLVSPPPQPETGAVPPPAVP